MNAPPRPRRPGPPAPFIVGSPRSGTTLLRLMLDSHPEIAIPPETHFVPELITAIGAGAGPEEAVRVASAGRFWDDLGLPVDEVRQEFRSLRPLRAAGALRAVYRMYADRFGKARWGDKTPAYVMHMGLISATLPEARFIHVIRDGRDVVLSQWKRADGRGAKRPPVERLAANWQRSVSSGRAASVTLDNYREVRFEELVTEPERHLQELCELLALDWDPSMLGYHERSASRLEELNRNLPQRGPAIEVPGAERLAAHALTKQPPDPAARYRWKAEMSREDALAFERVAGDLLDELGYELLGRD